MTSEHRDAQGSVWRRWDPHVHLPGTVLNNQFNRLSMADALDILAGRSPQIEAVGITDYLTTSSYQSAAAAWRGGAGSSVRMLFPNVELRLDVPTSRGGGVNVHLLCPGDEVDGMNRFLTLLEFSYQGKTYRADRQSLIELGRDFKNNPSLSEAASLREGTTQFKVSFEGLRDRYERDVWAKRHCLIAVAGGEGDGTSGLRDADGAFAARRQEIERFADVIFSGNPNQRLFWLGKGALSGTELVERYSGQKPCLHGSDAHGEDRLGLPNKDRFTWLKGNASFETLRQACIEPELRAWIGPEPPILAQARGRIRRVTVDNPGWFPEKTIPINPGLVAIIGPRGSGKTALADILAAGSGSTSQFGNKDSFLSRAGHLLTGSTAQIEWTDDDVTASGLATPAIEATGDPALPVRYLSQQFVEHLCASDGMSDELLGEIERVVFTSWPVGDRLESTSFRELLDIRLARARACQASELVAIKDASERITRERIVKSTLEAKKRELEEHKKALGQLVKEAADLTAKTDETRALRLAEVSSALQKREQTLQKEDRRVRSLRLLLQAVTDARRLEFPRLVARLRDAHRDAGLPDDLWDNFDIAFVGDVDAILTARIAEAETSRNAIGGQDASAATKPAAALDGISAPSLESRTVAELSAERVRLQKLAGIDQQRTRRLIDNSDQAARESAKIAHIKTEIQEAEAADAKIADLSATRLQRYAAYFDALLEEERELNELYGPLAAILAEGGETVSKLRFSVKRTIDLNTWSCNGEELLDLRKEGAFRGRGELARVARDKLVVAWRDGDGATAADAIRSFATEYSSGLRRQSTAISGNNDAYRSWELGVASWMYSAEHVTLNYSLEYDGLDIQRLSPGTRGIVLLLLYLAVDREETVPLIIDQPEENLDPESVYSELVRLFRQASNRRQVLMVTHNANLVVNTEVDQVIVASCGPHESDRLPELRYLSGGLEDTEVRDAVCQILEGGADAFRDRARRLRLRW